MKICLLFIAIVLALGSACSGGGGGVGGNGPTEQPFCRWGAQACSCDGNDACDVGLVCWRKKPGEHICVTPKSLENGLDEDGGSGFSGSGGLDADAAVAESDAATPVGSDAASGDVDAAAPLASMHELFVGNWTCLADETVDFNGKPRTGPTYTLVVNVSTTFTAQTTNNPAYDNTTRFDGDTFVVEGQGDAKDMYMLHIVTPTLSEGSWTDKRFPLMLTALSCTK